MSDATPDEVQVHDRASEIPIGILGIQGSGFPREFLNAIRYDIVDAELVKVRGGSGADIILGEDAYTLTNVPVAYLFGRELEHVAMMSAIEYERYHQAEVLATTRIDIERQLRALLSPLGVLVEDIRGARDAQALSNEECEKMLLRVEGIVQTINSIGMSTQSVSPVATVEQIPPSRSSHEERVPAPFDRFFEDRLTQSNSQVALLLQRIKRYFPPFRELRYRYGLRIAEKRAQEDNVASAALELSRALGKRFTDSLHADVSKALVIHHDIDYRDVADAITHLGEKFVVSTKSIERELELLKRVWPTIVDKPQTHGVFEVVCFVNVRILYDLTRERADGVIGYSTRADDLLQFAKQYGVDEFLGEFVESAPREFVLDQSAARNYGDMSIGPHPSLSSGELSDGDGRVLGITPGYLRDSG